LQTLAPLAAKGDPSTGRVRAFVLALSGDSAGAMAAINAAMPGSSSSVAPFLQRLPRLQSGQKAAAVNLGIFPDSGDARLASAGPTPNYGSSNAGYIVGQVTGSVTTNRLAEVDQLLSRPQAAPAPQQVSYSTPVRSMAARAAAVRPGKIWLQLASGTDAAALPAQFQRLKSRHRELFNGIPGYVAKTGDRARLVIGPFHSATDAEIFAEDLETAAISSFQWSNSAADQIVPIGNP
jgi:hypothetical protein